MKIVLTGGGTAGHVTPNMALLPALEKRGAEIHYIGSYEGIERGLVSEHGIRYYGIASGKLRRYADVKNLTDAFRIVKGLNEAVRLLRRIKPDIVFSKGGFVVVPVALAARLLGIPVVIHESDISPGLANKLILPFAKSVCVSFPETVKYIPSAVLTGSPIRKELFRGSVGEGRKIAGFDNKKPVILAMGGSQGAVAINQQLEKISPRLLEDFYIIHLCGKGNLPKTPMKGYAAFEYVGSEMPHILAAADIVVSRAGANTLFELLALRKPNLLIPLTKAASRGDQILNAASFERQGYSKVLQEENLHLLYDTLIDLYKNKAKYIKQMKKAKQADGTKLVMAEINRWIK